MCDYSLMDYESRLAVDGEELEVYHFSCGAKGLIVPAEPVRGFWNLLRRFWMGDAVTRVVCVPPGARLLLYDLPVSLQKRLIVQPCEEVSFDQLHAEEGTFRDAVRFDNGRVLSLQELPTGGRVKVLRFSDNDEPRLIPSGENLQFA